MTSNGEESGEVIKDGHKYLLYKGKLIPIMDENGEHEKVDEVH